MNQLKTRFLTPADLDTYRRVGSRFFPSTDWDNGIQRVGCSLRRWENGIFSVWSGNEMVGYVSVWPITQQAAEGVESGAIGDDDIDVNCIPESISYPHRNWICTVIVVVPAEKDVRREIILKLLGYLRTIMDDNRPCQIYAHAVTPDGERFCRRTGFKFGFLAIPCLCCLSHE